MTHPDDYQRRYQRVRRRAFRILRHSCPDAWQRALAEARAAEATRPNSDEPAGGETV